jgi:hypothetical protein
MQYRDLPKFVLRCIDRMAGEVNLSGTGIRRFPAAGDPGDRADAMHLTMINAGAPCRKGMHG